ncbi:MAG: N-6 DNA methylase, partial [Victivallales bacterium]|nr:N-6 DNA methylase [Victivallales bacterium]
MSKDKNKYGQYFTRKDIAQFMVSLIDAPKSARVLEPACGKGVFLDVLDENGFLDVKGYEIDAALSNEYSNVEHRSFISVPLEESYDVIIGNPPYIRWKNLEDELKQELKGNKLWNQYFNSLCDYLFIFILKSIEHLSENGELIFICSEYWLNTTHSSSLREYMCRHGYFKEIYHFKEASLFEGVTSSIIIFHYVKTSANDKPHKISFFKYQKRSAPSFDELHSRRCFQEISIPQFKGEQRWLLAPQMIQEKLFNLEKNCTINYDLFGKKVLRIGDICDIGNGMVSGLDKAFRVEDASVFSEEEKAFLIKVLKAKDLSQFYFDTSSKYLFIPPGISETTLLYKYPGIYKYFQVFRKELMERYDYSREIPYWEFVFPRNQRLFCRECPKIFVPCKERISTKKYFRFCYAPKGYYPLQDVTGLIPKNGCKESIEYILAYLNNPVV